jgi:hypothetical protein
MGVGGAGSSTPGPDTLYIDNEARSGSPNVQIIGLYGAVGSSNALFINDHDQGYNANAQMPISSTIAGKADVITGAFQTMLPNGNVKDINIPKPVSNQFVAGSITQTASLMNWYGVQSQVNMVESRAGKSPIVIDGNLVLHADGSISITNASGTTVFDQNNWSDASNPLAYVLSWSGNKFTLNLGGSVDTIVVNGYNVNGSTAAESRGLDIRADLTYSGVGAFVVNVATGMEARGIQFEGEAKNGSGNGMSKAVNVLAGQDGDGLAFITNGRIYLNQEGGGAAHVPTVQGFLYAQGYIDGKGQPKGVDIVGGNFQGMAIGSQVYIKSVNQTSGIVTDNINISGNQQTLTIPPQVPGGRPVYPATISNWREAR